MSDPRDLAQRERLAPILAELDAMPGATFLDLCELVLMLSERVDGSIKWEHPRVTVHIKQKVRLQGDARRKKDEGK